jgi:outer membrane protein assembly factor BamB
VSEKDKPGVGAEGQGYHLKESEIMAGTSDFRDGAFAFITEGSLALRELGNYGVAPPIPNGESAVTALAPGAGLKKIYGATSGRRSHLFYYDPSPAAEHVVDIGILGDDAECHILAADAAGVLHGLVNPGGRVFRYDPRGEFSVIWKFEARPVEFPGAELGEDAAAGVLDPASGKIYALGRRSSALIEVDTAAGTARRLVEIEGAGKSNALVIDGCGQIFGSSKNGHLFRYAIASGALDILDLQLPSPRGMEFLNHLDSAVLGGREAIFAGTTLGTIFRLDPEPPRVIGYGRPLSDHRIRALAYGKDGIVYGAAGSPGKNSHLFRWNPETGEVKDLGLPMVHFPKNWICYDISALAAGPNGEIYIGESERVSHLMIYYPPAGPPNAPVPERT